MLKYRYHFENENYLNWSPLYRSTDTNKYNDSFIDYDTEGSPIDGKVYGFKTEGELNAYLK